MSAVIRFKTALKSDERIRLMTEIISSIEIIKMYGWQKPFSKLISTARRSELQMVLKNAYVRALYMTFVSNCLRAILYNLMKLVLRTRPQYSKPSTVTKHYDYYCLMT